MSRFVSLLAVALVIGYWTGRALKTKLPAISFGDVVAIIIATCLAIVIHELGHVVGARLAGLRFRMFVVGPLMIRPEGVSYNSNLTLWGGITAAGLPPDHPSPRAAMLAFCMAGPILSLLGTLAMLAPSIKIKAFGFSSAAIALATLIPIGTSDGARVLQLLRNSAEGQRFIALATLPELIYSVRPRLWPATLIELLTHNIEPNADGFAAMVVRYGYHIDREEHSEAGEWIERALSHKDPPPGVHVAATEYYACIAPNLDRAREHLSKAIADPPTLAYIEACVRRAEGNLDEVRRLLPIARQSLQNYTGSSRESFAEVLDNLEP